MRLLTLLLKHGIMLNLDLVAKIYQTLLKNILQVVCAEISEMERILEISLTLLLGQCCNDSPPNPEAKTSIIPTGACQPVHKVCL